MAGSATGAVLRQRLVIGSRRSRPNANEEILGPGANWRRFHSAWSTRPTTLSTTAASNPASTSSARPWARFDITVEDRVEQLIRRQRVLVNLSGAQLG